MFNRIFGTSILVLVLATAFGCQTTRPNSRDTHSPARSGPTPNSSSSKAVQLPPTPRVVIVNRIPATHLATRGDAPLAWGSPQSFTLLTDVSRQTRKRLITLAKEKRCRVVEGNTVSGEFDLMVVLESVVPGNSFITRGLECESTITYTVSCYDDQNTRLATMQYQGAGRASEPMPVAIVTSLTQPITSLVTLDATYHIEYGAISRASIRKAVTDALTKIVSRATDPEWAREILVIDAENTSQDILVKRGIQFFATGDFDRAYLYFRKAVDKYPRYQPAACYYGACLARLGHYAEGLEKLQYAFDLDPGTQEAISARQWIAALIH